MKKLKIKYKCKNCGALNQLKQKAWSTNCKPVQCKQCKTLNHFISMKVGIFEYLSFIPAKYFKVYKRFIKKQKDYKKKLFGQTADIQVKQKIGRQVGHKLRNAFFKICFLTSNKERPTLKELNSKGEYK